MKICVLSPEEVGRLENYSIWPCCSAHHHHHISASLAKQGVEAGLLRWVGGVDTKIKTPVSMVTTVAIQMWQPVPTANLIGMRTWGLPRQR